MKTLVLSTKYQGYNLACYWHSISKSVEFYAVNKPLKFHTGFGFLSRFKTAKIGTNLSVEVHFRKLLKAQAIEVTTGEKVPMSSITYQQLTK